MSAKGNKTCLLFQFMSLCLRSIFFHHSWCAPICSIRFLPFLSKKTISLSKVLLSEQSLIFHFSCSNSKAFKWETVSSGSLEHHVSSEHTQGCPLAQLTAFAALTDAVLVFCNSVASVTRITELGQKSVDHETSSGRLSKIHQLFWST